MTLIEFVHQTHGLSQNISISSASINKPPTVSRDIPISRANKLSSDHNRKFIDGSNYLNSGITSLRQPQSESVLLSLRTEDFNADIHIPKDAGTRLMPSLDRCLLVVKLRRF